MSEHANAQVNQHTNEQAHERVAGQTCPDFLSPIDWTRPWLAHIRITGEAIAQASDWRAALNHCAQQRAIYNHQGLPIKFVPQALLPHGVAYEAFISTTGQVPTRENLHDFFNALVWLTFPATKSQLNALQAAEIAKTAKTNAQDNAAMRAQTSAPAGTQSRGPLRDAATIFDENAVLLLTSNVDLVKALRAHAWEEVFVARRAAFQQTCMPLLFGHALMEKLVKPYKAITGHMWVVATEPLPMTASSAAMDAQCVLVDAQLASQLQKGLTTSDFSPLPVLGVPGWWEQQGQQDYAFYRDQAVFRPPKKQGSSPVESK